MAKVCNTCGLPNELCVCEDVSKTQQSLKIMTEERSFGKVVTLISGFEDTNIDVDELSSDLKSKFACGGTFDDNKIELQGNHEDRLVNELEDMGFSID